MKRIIGITNITFQLWISYFWDNNFRPLAA